MRDECALVLMRRQDVLELDLPPADLSLTRSPARRATANDRR
jgi:hypothetical protein